MDARFDIGRSPDPIVQRPRTPPFHGGNTGSNPVRVATLLRATEDPRTNSLNAESVNFASTATDPNGTVSAFKRVFPGGTPASSPVQSPGNVRFDNPGISIISMTSQDNDGANDPSPSTRTITVPGEEVELDVAITQPPVGSTVSGKKVTVTITVAGTEEGTTNTFYFDVDGVQVATRNLARTEATLNWSTAGYAPGEHRLTAEVYDYEGHRGEVRETVTFTK